MWAIFRLSSLGFVKVVIRLTTFREWAYIDPDWLHREFDCAMPLRDLFAGFSHVADH
jgi:hypothetical protein